VHTSGRVYIDSSTRSDGQEIRHGRGRPRSRSAWRSSTGWRGNERTPPARVRGLDPYMGRGKGRSETRQEKRIGGVAGQASSRSHPRVCQTTPLTSEFTLLKEIARCRRCGASDVWPVDGAAPEPVHAGTDRCRRAGKDFDVLDGCRAGSSHTRPAEGDRIAPLCKATDHLMGHALTRRASK
jgi:hypothetical protein